MVRNASTTSLECGLGFRQTPLTACGAYSRRIEIEGNGLKLAEARLAEGAMDAEQVLSITALGAPLRQLMELIEGDVAEPQRDLLGTRNAHALPLL